MSCIFYQIVMIRLDDEIKKLQIKLMMRKQRTSSESEDVLFARESFLGSGNYNIISNKTNFNIHKIDVQNYLC